MLWATRVAETELEPPEQTPPRLLRGRARLGTRTPTPTPRPSWALGSGPLTLSVRPPGSAAGHEQLPSGGPLPICTVGAVRP